MVWLAVVAVAFVYLVLMPLQALYEITQEPEEWKAIQRRLDVSHLPRWRQAVRRWLLS